MVLIRGSGLSSIVSLCVRYAETEEVQTEPAIIKQSKHATKIVRW